MRVLSLFSGIGGIDLGLERAGHTVVAQSEVDPYCCRVLAKHWPDVPNLGDVNTIDWTDVERRFSPDLVAGGYPCQPFSLAGARREEDPRHLWPFMLDAIRVLRPRVALMENVPGHLSRGFDRVLGDLAESGYDAEWDCVSAASVGAPHRRDRVFIVAYPHGDELRLEPGWRSGANGSGSSLITDDGEAQSLADAEVESVGTGLRPHQPPAIRWRRPSDLDSAGDAWTVEPDVGRVAHGVPNRVDRLRGLGNAVVPQVAEHIGRMLAVA